MDIKQEISQYWDSMTGSEQAAAEIALEFMRSNFGRTPRECNDSDLAYFAQRGCMDVDNGNAEVEYTEEDFYCEEVNIDIVVDYLRLLREYELQNNIPYL